MAEWDPDVDIDEALVRALLAEQFAQLEARAVRLVGEGFDNSVWLVDEEWAFRFPRRALAVPLVSREVAVLPRLAPLVPIPIPIPAFIGRESERLSETVLRASDTGWSRACRREPHRCRSDPPGG